MTATSSWRPTTPRSACSPRCALWSDVPAVVCCACCGLLRCDGLRMLHYTLCCAAVVRCVCLPCLCPPAPDRPHPLLSRVHSPGARCGGPRLLGPHGPHGWLQHQGEAGSRASGWRGGVSGAAAGMRASLCCPPCRRRTPCLRCTPCAELRRLPPASPCPAPNPPALPSQLVEIDNSNAPEWLKKVQKLPYTERILAECLQVRFGSKGRLLCKLSMAGACLLCTAACCNRASSRERRSPPPLTLPVPPLPSPRSSSSCPPSAPAASTSRAPRATSTERRRADQLP